jgi:1,4-dihydroxy-2-naphthoyl-CoA hydrolase
VTAGDGTGGTGDFISTLGLHVEEMTATRMTGWMDAGPQHHQPFGIVHGGVWASVVETFASIAGTEAVRERGQVVVGISNSTDFFRQHRQGRVNIVATPIHQGRTQQVWQVAITRAEDDRLVARGQVRLQNINAA